MQYYFQYSKQRGLIASLEYVNRLGPSQVDHLVGLSRGIIFPYLFCGELGLTAEEVTHRWFYQEQHDRRSNH
jgi:hypothetical protein